MSGSNLPFATTEWGVGDSHQLQTLTKKAGLDHATDQVIRDSVPGQVRSCKICGGQSGEWGRYSLHCPLLIHVPLSAPHSLIILSLLQYSLGTESMIKQPT